MHHRDSLRLVLVLFVVWRVALSLMAVIAPFVLQFRSSFVDAELLARTQLPHWLVAWANFDGVHYLTLVSRGYLEVGFIQAFFPGLVILLRPVWHFTHDLGTVVIIGQVLSSLFFFAALFLLRSFTKLYAADKGQNYFWMVVILLLFPTSFFFASLYTESFFLLFVLASLMAARKQHWWLAGLFAAVASGTRVVGIMLVPALFIELGSQTQLWNKQTLNSTSKLMAWFKRNYVSIVAIAFGSIGLLCYSLYLWYHFDDPLYFFHVQSEFGSGREESIILFPQVIWRYLKILVSVPLDLRFPIYVQEFVMSVGGLLVLLFGRKLVRPSLWWFSLAALLMPTLTGTFSSMPRYILVCPAIFLILAQWLQHRFAIRWIWLVISMALLVFNVILFIQGYWVA